MAGLSACCFFAEVGVQSLRLPLFGVIGDSISGSRSHFVSCEFGACSPLQRRAARRTSVKYGVASSASHRSNSLLIFVAGLWQRGTAPERGPLQRRSMVPCESPDINSMLASVVVAAPPVSSTASLRCACSIGGAARVRGAGGGRCTAWVLALHPAEEVLQKSQDAGPCMPRGSPRSQLCVAFFVVFRSLVGCARARGGYGAATQGLRWGEEHTKESSDVPGRVCRWRHTRVPEVDVVRPFKSTSCLAHAQLPGG